jgi:RNA polymerase sigma-70 factor (ECF subfamily)
MTITPGFEKLIEEVLPLAYGVAFRLTRNQADAEDIVQEAALQAHRGFKSFQPGTNFRAWFLRVLKNCFLMKYRKRKREGESIDVEEAPAIYILRQSMVNGLNLAPKDPSETVVGNMDAEQIARAVTALPAEYRLVTALYFLEDMSYEEIAEIVECPIGTVRSRLHRGRRMLQKALWHIAEEAGIVTRLKQETMSAEEQVL